MYLNSEIKEISAFVPKKMLKTKDNPNFEGRQKFMFESVVGIKQIHVCETSNFGMALKASEPLETYGVDYIVYVTQTPDVPIPGMSHKIAHALGLKCGCIDLNAACNGFIQGYMVASMLAEQDNKVLLIFSEWLTKIQDPESTNALMFGDAAVAMIVDFGGGAEFKLKSDGSRFESVWQPENYLLMDGDTVSDFAFTDVKELIADWYYSRYDFVVLHQSNMFILKQIAKQLNIPEKKLSINIDRYGNTSAVSIPLALATEKPKGMILACGYGAGLNYGVCKFDYNPVNIYYNEG